MADETNTLVAMWQSGSSAGVIAAKVGRTRNSVCGKIDRIRRSGIKLAKRGSDHVVKRSLYKLGIWSDAQTQSLIDMWTARKTSAQIGAAIGKATGAVDRKITRLRESGVELPHHGSGRRKGGYRPLGSPRRAPTAPVYIPEVIDTIPADKSRLGASGAIMAISSGECKYPFGNPASPEFHFCCLPIRENSAFCVSHHALCYRQPEPMSSADLKHARFLSAYARRVGAAQARVTA
jgi:GcrA cell cycle regulator